MFQRGADRVNSAISVFTKAKTELELGIKEIEEEQVTHENIIKEAKETLVELDVERVYAHNVLAQVVKILAG